MAITDTQQFTVLVQTPVIQINLIRVVCEQRDGTMQEFNVYPEGEIPSGIPGPSNIHFSLIEVQNVGDMGDCFIRVTDDTGAQLHYEEFWINAGGRYWTMPFFADMPNRDYTITVEAGYL